MVLEGHNGINGGASDLEILKCTAELAQAV